MMPPAIEATQQRYALCIGVNHAPLSQMPVLQFAQGDAEAVHELLLARNFASSNTQLLPGEQAITTEITQALQRLVLSRPKRQDLVVVYFAGHGVRIACPDEDDEDDEVYSDVFLVSATFDLQTLKQDRGAWLSYPLRLGKLRQEFFEQTRSRKVIFLLDCCHSGDFFGKAYRSLPPQPQESIKASFAHLSTGRIVLSSCMPQQKAYEDERLGHGRFTFHLLRALRGEERRAARSTGMISVGSLFDYISEVLPSSQRPVRGGVEHGSFDLWYVPEFDEHLNTSPPPSAGEHSHQKATQQALVKALVADHHSFLADRLATFVGREPERAKIWEQIETLKATGGYLILSGQAGQGKSSLVAKLVEEYCTNQKREWEQVAFHFIPFHPGPDHQVGLLRNLMARLILLYDLPEFYVASEHRPALRDLLPKVLAEVAARGGQEAIFIDGLDQIEEDMSGRRDLSFLPLDPPAGIVFVLGTRPDDTLEHLRLCKPSIPSVLEPLSFSDFTLLLGKRQITLEAPIQEQLYRAAEANALFLGLVAGELQALQATSEISTADIRAIVAQIAHDPVEVFSLSIARLKRQPLEWREVIKPILGALLVAQRPFSLWELRHLLGVDDERVRDGLSRLGGLLTIGGQEGLWHYSLFHLKFYEYLQQDEKQSRTSYVFAADEVEGRHERLACWCEQGGIEVIWQQSLHTGEQRRRTYAREHYLTHLFYARLWKKLIAVLDDANYGQAKIAYDPSTYSFAQDLELGQRAATWEGWTLEEGIAHLAHLWRFTWLRARLRSRVDHYPLQLFETLLSLGQGQRVFGLAELLTDRSKLAQVWTLILRHLGQDPAKSQEYEAFFSRFQQWLFTITSRSEKATALADLAQALSEREQWEQAHAIASSIESRSQKITALVKIAQALTKSGRWEQAHALWLEAEAIANSIEDRYDRATALARLAQALTKSGRWEQAQTITSSIEDQRDKASLLSNIAQALTKSGQWEQAHALWLEAEAIANSIEDRYDKATALASLAQALTKSGRWEQAQTITSSIEDQSQKTIALAGLAQILAQSGRWEQAQEVCELIDINQQIFLPGNDLIPERLTKALVAMKQSKQAEYIISWITHPPTKRVCCSLLIEAYAGEQQWDTILGCIQQQWKAVKTTADAAEMFALATVFLSHSASLGMAFYEAFKWVDAFFQSTKLHNSVPKG